MLAFGTMEGMQPNADRNAEKIDVLTLIYERARAANATIALADTVSADGSEDERMRDAVTLIESRGLGKPLLVTPNYFTDLSADEQDRLINTFTEARAARGKPIPHEEALRLLSNDPKYVASAMVKADMADGYMAGNNSTTENTLRPALQIIGTTEGYASSYFIMIFPDGRTLFFADCGLNYDPNPEQLAKIAIYTAQNAQNIGIEPRVAFLSFSTAGSATHEHIDKVKEAIRLARGKAPDLKISEQEMQFDAAFSEEIAARKLPGADIAGKATVIIFPNLMSGNIGYKIAHALGTKAIGPIIQGMNAPANDLSRNCSAEDIVDVFAVTAMQVGALKKERRS